ncbi:hypothetical protein BSZ19_35035 [Bradyrhizobium japonicum]|uniref:Uncharacterized protein n=2 Tax=Nitrobacteraceae TaxID=41294 RepID=A0A1Y2JGD1_BRAJP|nr:hypothetical protein BSZ19_35035 [Bradyrhizobium japonicum]
MGPKLEVAGCGPSDFSALSVRNEPIKQENAMRRDLLAITGGMLAVGATVWAFWGNPENPARLRTVQEIKANPEQKRVSEQSPYMRNER